MELNVLSLPSHKPIGRGAKQATQHLVIEQFIYVMCPEWTSPYFTSRTAGAERAHCRRCSTHAFVRLILIAIPSSCWPSLRGIAPERVVCGRVHGRRGAATAVGASTARVWQHDSAQPRRCGSTTQRSSAQQRQCCRGLVHIARNHSSGATARSPPSCSARSSGSSNHRTRSSLSWSTFALSSSVSGSCTTSARRCMYATSIAAYTTCVRSGHRWQNATSGGGACTRRKPWRRQQTRRGCAWH
jgi:hypothetical protein